MRWLQISFRTSRKARSSHMLRRCSSRGYRQGAEIIPVESDEWELSVGDVLAGAERDRIQIPDAHTTILQGVMPVSSMLHMRQGFYLSLLCPPTCGLAFHTLRQNSTLTGPDVSSSVFSFGLQLFSSTLKSYVFKSVTRYTLTASNANL